MSKHSALQVRKRIYEFINSFPGIHLRELERKTEEASGKLRHHLLMLQRSKLINVEKSRGSTRYFPLGLQANERRLLGVLRQHMMRRIVVFFLEKGSITHKDVLNNFTLASSTITWYLRQLEHHNIITVKYHGRKKYYQLNNKEGVSKVLIAYKESFMDRVVDKFIETWQ